LFNYGEEINVLEYYLEALDIWKGFLGDVPQHYKERWDMLSDYGFDYSKPSV